MSEGISNPLCCWWYGREPAPQTVVSAGALDFLGHGEQDPPQQTQVVIFADMSATQVRTQLLSWSHRGFEPTPLLVAESPTPEIVVLQPSQPVSWWLQAIRLAHDRHHAQQSIRGTTRELQRLRRQLSAAEGQLRDRQEELVRLETQAAMSQLVRSLAHELNNPLAVILGNAELIERSAVADERLGRRAQTIISEVGDCQAIIERLRRYSRPQGEAAKGVFINDAIAQALERLRRRGHPIPDVTLAEHMPSLLCGRLALVRALGQILDNAVRAGAQRVWITIDRGQRAGYSAVRIHNDGSTPSDDDIRKAFRPFFSGSGGAGLGLSLATSLLAEYRGTVTLSVGPEGHGATCSIELPIYDRHMAEREHADSSSDHWFRAVQQTEVRHLLVLEDDPMVAELIILTGEEMGWVVRLADSIEVARHEMQGWDVHAMIVDVRVGQGDGIDLAREFLLSHPAMGDMIAIMSGDMDKESVRQMVRDWACPTLAKPFPLQQLRQLLTNMARNLNGKAS